jgi:hypothetical protein
MMHGNFVAGNQARSSVEQCTSAPPPPRPFLQELNERFSRLDEHLQETLKLSADLNCNLFGPRSVGEDGCKGNPHNNGCTALLLEKLTSIEQLAFYLRDQVNQTRQIL